MAPAQCIRCPFGNHNVKGRGVQITEPNIVRFIQKRNPYFRPQQLMCAECKRKVLAIYREKYKRALELKRRSLSIRISDLSLSTSTSVNFDPGQLAETQTSSSNRDNTCSTSTDYGPSTSAAAKARRDARNKKRKSPKRVSFKHKKNKLTSSEEKCSSSSETDSDSENWQRAQNSHRKRMRDVRLPDVQPILPTQLIQLNKDVMEMYMQGLTGG